ncbi:MAG: LuxR C-terminal-related transcriptional regulator [Alphaproteobacteria bacterium]
MTSVCLVGKDCIAKEGLKGMLARAAIPISADYEDPAGLYAEGRHADADGLIINIDTDNPADPRPGIFDTVRRQKSSYPQSRVVILSSRQDVPAITAAFSTGADGYIMKDISGDGLIGSLRLVMSGEKVFPPVMTDSVPGPANNDGTPTRRPLSERETGIIRHLAAGESNKAIALQLNIREATVKTHVKKILKKLGLANRTQAAVWAIARGLDRPLVN